MARVHRNLKIDFRLCIAVLLCSFLSVAADSPILVVTVPVANMYSAASPDSDVVSQALYASNVIVIEEKPAWAKVETSDHYRGWISLDQTRQLSSPAARYASSGKVLQVWTRSANLYREPDEKDANHPVFSILTSHLMAVIEDHERIQEDWERSKKRSASEQGDVIAVKIERLKKRARRL